MIKMDCNECGSKNKEYDARLGEQICKDCGLVLVTEMFELVNSLMTEEEQEKFSNYCHHDSLKATDEEMIDYIKKNLLKEKN